MTLYRTFFDHVLVRTDAETAHRMAFAALRASRPLLTARRHEGSGWEAMGLRFPGPLGIAAGFDKNAEGIDSLAALGFSFVEIGTVTAAPQPGNPRPRLVRLPSDRAVVNRMGFNNDGAEVVARRLRQRLARRRGRGSSPPVVVGVNIGKTKVVPEDEAVADYETSTRLLAPYADYLVVNVSSPNTPGLRDLQAVGRLRPLLKAVRAQADAVTDHRLPLLVKIAPDLSDADVRDVADLAQEVGLDGIVATNTTTSRNGLRSGGDEVAKAGDGGLSGAPLADRSVEVLRLLRARLDDRLERPGERLGDEMVLISVGGIRTAQDAYERIRAGATLLQGYTAFIYEGPSWPRKVQRELTALMREGRG